MCTRDLTQIVRAFAFFHTCCCIKNKGFLATVLIWLSSCIIFYLELRENFSVYSMTNPGL